MFDIGWSEMALILLVALVVIGPRDLPRVARTMGKWVAKGRAMAREFQTALEDMAREAELDKVKSEIEKAGRTDLGKTIEKTIDPSGELSKALEPPVLGGQPAAGAPTQPPAPAKSAIAPAPPEQPASGLAPGVPTDPAAAAVAPAAPATSEASAAAGNGTDAADERKRPRRATAPTEPS